MYFHIVGIKEKINQKYNIDILIKGESETFIRDFLHHYNIIVLNFLEYKRDINNFGNIKATVNYKNQHLDLYFHLDDIQKVIYELIIIGFDLRYINFLDNNKLDDQVIKNLIQDISSQIETETQEINKNFKKIKEREKQIYTDERLKKILSIVGDCIQDIRNLLLKVGDYQISQDKIRDLKIMQQDLIKLKMGRNIDKMIEILENIYHKSYEIEREYLDTCETSKEYLIPNSKVSKKYIKEEILKLKKAKKIKQIGARRDIEDTYYLSFESTGIYIKFILKDLKYKFKKIPIFIYNLFDYLELTVLTMIILVSLFLWYKKVSYSLDQNLYAYFFMAKAGLFGVGVYSFKFLRSKNLYKNVLFLALTICVYFILFWLFKNNFAF